MFVIIIYAFLTAACAAASLAIGTLKWRAGNIVHSYPVAEINTAWFATMLTMNTDVKQIIFCLLMATITL
jgi:hypothetical protein